MDDKKFVMPEAEIVSYSDEDIITQSLVRGDEDPGFEGEPW